MDSLPVDYDNVGEALLYQGEVENPNHPVFRTFRDFRPADDSEPNRPNGVFYDKDGNVRTWPVLDANAEPPTPANQYGWVLNAYGSRK